VDGEHDVEDGDAGGVGSGDGEEEVGDVEREDGSGGVVADVDVAGDGAAHSCPGKGGGVAGGLERDGARKAGEGGGAQVAGHVDDLSLSGAGGEQAGEDGGGAEAD